MATKPCEDVYRSPGSPDVECTEAQRSRYYAKISGPLLDRIDIQVEAPGVKFQDIVSKSEGESSEEIRNRVGRARLKQLERFEGRRFYANAQMGPKEVKIFCRIGREGEKLGKSLTGVLKGLYRYRIGDYRIMYSIDRGDNQISILYVGRRKDIYR